MRKIRAFFSKSEHFFSVFKKGQEKSPPPPNCTPIYNTIKAKRRKRSTRRKALVEMLFILFHLFIYLFIHLFIYLFIFNFTQMKPFTDIFQGFWPDIQLEHLLDSYFRE